ncbi:MAG: trigger factor [Lachnospiraceae bacterium]|nr:trigger factor [Lachnospiraceae bacterium]
MSSQVEKLEKNMVKFTITVDAEEVEKAIERAYQKQKSKISIPGFRKGKVPRKLIEKEYGKGVFYEDAANDMIPTAYQDAIKESDLEIVSRPVIDVTQLESGKDFIFTAEVAVKPEVTLADYVGLEVPKTETEVTDDEVNAEIDKEREQNARIVSVEDRAVEDKDMVTIDFEGFVDGVAFEGGKGTDYPLTIGSHSFIDTFEEQLIGKNIGEETDVNVKFPEEYHAEELKGKDATFKVTVKKIQKKELPEVNDEFASEVSEFETVAEYKDDIKKNLEEKKANEAKAAKQDAVIDKIIEGAQMEIPDAMVDFQVEQMAQDFERRLTSQGLSVDQYFAYTGMDAKQLEEQMKPQALKKIQTRLVLEAIASKENIEVSDEEFNKEVEDMAKAYQMEKDTLEGYLSDSDKENIKKDIMVRKAAEFAADNAKEA